MDETLLDELCSEEEELECAVSEGGDSLLDSDEERAPPSPAAIQLPATQLSNAQPPVTQPPVTHPPVTQPPVNQRSVTQPPVNQRSVTQPPVNHRSVTQPPVNRWSVTQRSAAQLPVTQPPVTEQCALPLQSGSVWESPGCWPASPSTSRAGAFLSAADDLISRCRDELGRSKVIRLDGPKKFRCVPDTLPELPLPRRRPLKRVVTARPRRITKPSLLLEVKGGWLSALHHSRKEDRQVTERIVRPTMPVNLQSPPHQMATTNTSASGVAGPMAATRTASGVAGPMAATRTTSGVAGPMAATRTVSGLAATNTSQEDNPFLSKLRGHSNINPFFTALQKEDLQIAARKDQTSENSFSFSLAQFTS